MVGTGAYQQQIRFALRGLGAQNGQFTFERVCRELARATICQNVVPATGPVSAGGDQGRDFETFPTFLSGHVGDVGSAFGLQDGDAVSFLCTLQQRRIRSKILDDVAKTVGSGEAVRWIVAYCEVDLPVAARHGIEQAAKDRHGVRLVIFDGNAIAELLATRPAELSDVVAEWLQIRPEGAAAHVPRDLPRAPLRFVNRKRELLVLDRIAGDADEAAGPRVAVLAGMHGVGKSAVGRVWSNRNRERFPGGDLFGDCSKRRLGAAVDLNDMLGGFLHDLGAADGSIPVDFGDRQRLFHRMTAGRKLLLLLDDVDQPAQVLSLIPSGAGSMVIATTNFDLEELFWEGAELVQLEPLDADTSRRLLEDFAGTQRIAEDAAASEDLISLCGGLPIVLCVCGGTLAANPARTIGWLVARVKASPRRLTALSGTGSFAVEAIFDFAYEALAAPAMLLYRRLSLHAGPDVVAPVAAVLTGVPTAEAATLLEGLRSAHLIEMPAVDRFRMHDLIRQHALACAERDDKHTARSRAVRRLVDWFYAATRAADWAVIADRLRLTDGLDVASHDVPAFGDAIAAFDWFAAERQNVMAAVRTAFDREWDDRVWQFAEALWPLCASHNYFSEWIESHVMAVESSVRLGDRSAEARVRSQLARAYAETGHPGHSHREMEAATRASEACGNRMLQASVVEFRGVCDLRLGHAEEAFAAFLEARDAFTACNYPRGVALQDLYTGSALVALGRHSEALAVLDAAHSGLTQAGDEISLGRALVCRGAALRQLGLCGEAAAALRAAVGIMERLGIRFEQAEAFETLAALAEDTNDRELARQHRQRAYRIYEDLGHPRATKLFLLLAPIIR